MLTALRRLFSAANVRRFVIKVAPFDASTETPREFGARCGASVRAEMAKHGMAGRRAELQYQWGLIWRGRLVVLARMR